MQRLQPGRITASWGAGIDYDIKIWEPRMEESLTGQARQDEIDRCVRICTRNGRRAREPRSHIYLPFLLAAQYTAALRGDPS